MTTLADVRARFAHQPMDERFWQFVPPPDAVVNGISDWYDYWVPLIYELWQTRERLGSAEGAFIANGGAPLSNPNGGSSLNFHTASGSGNAYTITTSPAHSALVTGQWFLIKFPEVNTGPSTLKIDGLQPYPVISQSGNSVLPGALRDTVLVVFNGTGFQSVAQNTAITEDVTVDVNPAGGGDFQTIEEAAREIQRFYGAVGDTTVTLNLSNHTHNVNGLVLTNPVTKLKFQGGGRSATKINNQSGEWAIQAINQRLAIADLTVENGGIISAAGGIVGVDNILVKDAPGAGIYSSKGQMSASSSEVMDCRYGFMCAAHGRMSASSNYAHHNTDYNFRATSMSYLYARACRSEHSKYGFHSDGGSFAYAHDAICRNNTVAGNASWNGAFLYASNQNLSGNNVDYTPAPNQLVNGALILV